MFEQNQRDRKQRDAKADSGKYTRKEPEVLCKCKVAIKMYFGIPENPE